MSLLLLTDSHHLCSSKEKMTRATRITNCWNVLRAMQPTLRLLAVGTCNWQGMRISPLHLSTFLLAWPKQAKIGFNDHSCSRTARHELKCLLYGQGTSEITGREPRFSLYLDNAAVAV